MAAQLQHRFEGSKHLVICDSSIRHQQGGMSAVDCPLSPHNRRMPVSSLMGALSGRLCAEMIADVLRDIPRLGFGGHFETVSATYRWW